MLKRLHNKWIVCQMAAFTEMPQPTHQSAAYTNSDDKRSL